MVSPRLTCKVTTHLKTCTVQYRNKLKKKQVKNGNNWPSTSTERFYTEEYHCYLKFVRCKKIINFLK